MPPVRSPSMGYLARLARLLVALIFGWGCAMAVWTASFPWSLYYLAAALAAFVVLCLATLW